MKILGIQNRTENWKTACYFSQLLGEKSIYLAERLGENPRPQSGDVKLELFWKGMRDFLYQTNVKKESAKQELVDLYMRLFPNLRGDIEKFGNFQELKSWNYDVSTINGMTKLVNNLMLMVCTVGSCSSV